MHLSRHPDPVRLSEGGRIPFLFVLRELEEAGDGDAGLALWQMLRNVRIRIDTPASPGRAILGEGARELLEVVPGLRTTLHGMDRMLREDEPTGETWEGLVLGCAHVAHWAEGKGAYRTALAFFHLAEEMDSGRPHLGYHIGRLARKLALYDAAEAWMRWAYRLGRVKKAWEVCALCLSGLGNLFRQKGNLPRARRHHEVCLRIARKYGLRMMEGDALYELAVMSFWAGRAEDGMDFARHALAVYGSGHGRVYSLAHDVAWFWMDHYGAFSRAAEVFRELLPHSWAPPLRLLLFANYTRAASGAGWSGVYETSWNETWALLRQQSSRVGHAAALVQLAHAASYRGDWERARIAATEAIQIAEARNEAEEFFTAESILASVASDCVVEKAVRSNSHHGGTILDSDAAELVSLLTASMNARWDGAPESPTRARIGVA